MRKLAWILCVLFLIGVPASAEVEARYVLLFPLPEDAVLMENTSNFQLYQFGKTTLNTSSYPRKEPDKSLEDYLDEAYPTHGEIEALETVEVDGYDVECVRFSFAFEDMECYGLSALCKTEDTDYLLLIDVTANEPAREEIESWLADLQFSRSGVEVH